MKIGEGTEYRELIALLRAYRPDYPDMPPQVFRPVPVKQITQLSMGAILGALGLRFEIHTDDEQLARIRHRLAKRKNAGTKIPAQRRYLIFAKNPDLARTFRTRQILLQSPRHRREIARHAAQVRWRRYRDMSGRKGQT